MTNPPIRRQGRLGGADRCAPWRVVIRSLMSCAPPFLVRQNPERVWRAAPAVPACARRCALPVDGCGARAARRRLSPRFAVSQGEDRKGNEQRLADTLRTPALARRPAPGLYVGLYGT